MSHFAADRAGTNDAYSLWKFCQRENGFVGQVVDLIQAFDRWSRRSRSGCDHRSFEHKFGPLNIDCLRAREAGLPKVDVDAQVLETFGGVVFADLCAEFPHAAHDPAEIDLGSARYVDRKVRRVLDGCGHSSRTDDSFGRYASDVQAITAHQVTFNEGDSGSQPSGSRRGDQSRCAGTNDNQVIRLVRTWIGPIGRVNVRFKLLVVFVVGKQSVHEVARK